MMDPRTVLRQTLDDRKLSRPERQSLAQLLDGVGREPRLLDNWRAAAFELAREALGGSADGDVLGWLEEVVRVLRPREDGADAVVAECHFSPGEDCPRAIARHIDLARKTIDVCVFTITDDRLTGSLLAAHGRGVRVRLVTDNDKSADLGSDVERLGRGGVAVRVDRSPFHMHHKFAIFDGATLINGSYNWTRGASRDNEENLIVTNDRRLVGAFLDRFERTWEKLG
jgi:phosphatidylserine/phosphatidylglycerophosphate/cardiolipin synthase-like enzyme